MESGIGLGQQGTLTPLLSSHTITYAYDSLYRLTNANYSTGDVFIYTYDAVGNRLTQQTLTQTTVYTYDNANRLTNVNGVAQIWDDNGNLLNDGASTYAYDSANRLITVTQGANVYAFAYNGQGDRLRQTINGAVTTYTLDLNAGLTQVLADGANTYLYGTMRIGELQSGGFAYHLPDALGSVRQVANSSGGVTLAKSYEPFGAVLTSAGSGTSIFGWAGEARDATGLVFLRARYYSVTTGRFFVRDSWPGNVQMPGTLHPYLYGMDNPTNYVDPTGHDSWWQNPTQTPTLTNTPTFTPSPTQTPSPTNTPTFTPSPTNTSAPTMTPSATPNPRAMNGGTTIYWSGLSEAQLATYQRFQGSSNNCASYAIATTLNLFYGGNVSGQDVADISNQYTNPLGLVGFLGIFGRQGLRAGKDWATAPSQQARFINGVADQLGWSLHAQSKLGSRQDLINNLKSADTGLSLKF
jgi:RHS repeat-associated protein